MGDDESKAGCSKEPAAQTSAEDESLRKAREAYERGLIERGEAAPADEHGKLPPGATHEIVGYDNSGKPILKRRRFSGGLGRVP
jgi:hypothetical protein